MEIVIDPVLEELSRRGWVGLKRQNLPGVSTHTALPATREALADLEMAWAGPSMMDEPEILRQEDELAVEGGALD